MVHVNNHSNQLRIFTKKYDRFSFDKLIGKRKTLDKQKELLEKLTEFELKGMLDLKWIVFCPDCGADLEFFTKSMKNQPKDCIYCGETNIVDPQNNVQLMVFLTERGKLFFRNEGWENWDH